MAERKNQRRNKASWSFDYVLQQTGHTPFLFERHFERFPHNILIRIDDRFRLVKGERLVDGKYRRVKDGKMPIDRLVIDQDGLDCPIFL